MRDNYSFGEGRALAATRFCGGPNAPDWEHVQTVDTATRATLKLSKDNVIFGVRAVDSAGHRSLPVVPEAGTIAGSEWWLVDRSSRIV